MSMRALNDREKAYLAQRGIKPVLEGIGGVFTCRLCRRRKVPAEFTYNQFGVCGTCADAIANLYNNAHGSGYLTWAVP